VWVHLRPMTLSHTPPAPSHEHSARRGEGERKMAFDIEYAERTIRSSKEEALRRMRQADEKLERAQRATRDKDTQLAQALEEYNRCVAALVDYLNVSSRHHRANNEEG
jgi:hypothetical protein